jgi:hypothetical protein
MRIGYRRYGTFGNNLVRTLLDAFERRFTRVRPASSDYSPMVRLEMSRPLLGPTITEPQSRMHLFSVPIGAVCSRMQLAKSGN